MFTIDYLGQSSIFCEFDSYLILYCVLLSFVERLKHKRVKISVTTRALPEYFPLVSLRSIQSVALNVFHVCFRMVLPWKRSGFLDRSPGRLIFCAVSLTRMIRQLIPVCFESLKPNGVLARILTVSHPIIERSASAF